ncbi:MAG: ABC transporter ATP-binding protein, partial [Alphaproteobacteria bacterium]
LDEPTAGVDVELRTQLWDYVRALNKGGTTVLLTTHYLEEEEELCDEIAIINHGQIIAHDSKAALMGKLDQKQITFTLTAPLAAIPAGLSDLAPALREGKLVVQYQPSRANMDAILTRVREAGLTIKDVSTEEADLEDIFRTLTKRAA